MKKLLKIDNRFINPEHIVWAVITGTSKKPYLEVGVASRGVPEGASDVFRFEGEEAIAIINHLSDPSRAIHLGASTPHEIEDYQAYVYRGGDMSFEDFGAALRRQQRLASLETPTESQLDQCSKLESQLFL